MEYLVKKTKHYTGEVFIDATKIKENETFEIVEAENPVELKAKLDMKQFWENMSYYASKLNEVARNIQDQRKQG